MQKIMLIEDDPLFVRRVKRTFSDIEIYSYLSPVEFWFDLNKDKDLFIDKIHNTNLFFLDFHLTEEENIFNSGVFEMIFCNKNQDAKIISISNNNISEIEKMMIKMGVDSKFKYDSYFEKDIRLLSKAIGLY